MKYVFPIAVLVFVVALCAPASSYAADCSCSAPDNSCSCGVHCPNDGCAAACTEGSCLCCCLRLCPLGSSLVSLDVKDAPVSTVAALLSKSTGRKVDVVGGGDTLVSVNVENITLGQTLRLLQNFRGVTLSLDGQPVVRKPTNPAARVSVCFQDTPLPLALELLSQATGATFKLDRLPPNNVTLKTEGTLPQILNELSNSIGTTVSIR